MLPFFCSSTYAFKGAQEENCAAEVLWLISA